MNNTEPIYSGRKIRFEDQDELKKDSVELEEKTATETKPEEGVVMTFGEACSKGLLKPGMAVVFKNCDFAPIELDEEIIGKEQEVSCSLDKGIVVENKEGQLEIFAVLATTLIAFTGRVGRANSAEIIRFIFSKISKELRNSVFHFVEENEFRHFLEDNYLFLQYLNDQNFDKFLLSVSDIEMCRAYYHSNWCGNTMLSFEKIFRPGMCITGYYKDIAINIAGRDLKVSLKKGKEKIINSRHTFKENPYEIYVEIWRSTI